MIKEGRHELYPNSRFWAAWTQALGEDSLAFHRRGRTRILALTAVLCSLLLLLVFCLAQDKDTISLLGQPVSMVGIATTALLVVVILFWMIWRVLLDPLLKMCNWADLMRGVNLDARVILKPDSDFSELADDINMLANMINQLSRDTEAQLQEHTDYISRESRSLSVLYEVASSINTSRDLNELFKVSIESLCVNLNASAGIVRSYKAKNKDEIVASYGNLNQTFLASIDRLLPQSDSQSGNSNQPSVFQIDRLENSTAFTDDTNETQKDLIALTIFVGYRRESLGVMHLFFPEMTDQNLEQYRDLLLSVGQHLGTAIEKHRLDEEESQLVIMQERNRISHELHDSLAQTLASIRLQIRVLGEIVLSNDEQSIQHQMERLEFSIETANNQLRELIDNFSVPMHRRGLVSSIEEAIELTRSETGINVYFQNEWPAQELTANEEHNILRIVQESLANIRKHSQAKGVRILFSQKNGINRVLIEDDGIGFDESTIKPGRGRHIGLIILRDRAKQIGGDLNIESEHGEGTQVRLQFRVSSGTDAPLVQASEN
ncbi:MAG: histidine kinase [Pseudomonadota bacterium]